MSTVIQKFLDTQHLPLLKQYMEKVAEDSTVMRPAYAAVLLSLYVQLRDGDSLRRFLDRSISDSGYKWDVDEAISTCLSGALAGCCHVRVLIAGNCGMILSGYFLLSCVP